MREKKPILPRVKEVKLFKNLAPPLVAAFLVLSPISTPPCEFASLLSAESFCFLTQTASLSTCN